jgi:hypothetical protein
VSEQEGDERERGMERGMREKEGESNAEESGKT